MNFNFKKKFGQNFISDKNLLGAICNDADITKNDEVLEIGAGMGALTKQLCGSAKKVVAYEIDQELKQHLQALGCNNLTLHFEDALKKPLEQIENDFAGKYKLVANLPYYITTPLIFKFLQSQKIVSLTIMVQKEVGQRIVAKPGGKDYGALSVCCQHFCNNKIMRVVPRNMFTPQPEVDSCIVKMQIENKFNQNSQKFFNLVKICFKSRRKTLLNNLSEGLGLDKSLLSQLGFNLSVRAEQLSCQQFEELAKILDCYLGQDEIVPMQQ